MRAQGHVLLSGWRAKGRPAAAADRLEIELRAARERIASLEQELLAGALAADAAAKELDSLTYGISHDLRAPLRAIEGFARMLQEDFALALGAEGHGHLQVIREAAKKLDRLIEGMLALSRVSRQALAPVDVDMAALAQQAVDNVRRAHDAAATPVVSREIPPIRGDAVLLLQLWTLLVDNAVKFSSRTPAPKIEVGGRLEAQNAIYFVKDNGAGFDMRYALKLFNVFQRLHAEKEFPGVGVGLAIASRIVSRHGGRVWAEGERDKGACFYFALPMEGT